MRSPLWGVALVALACASVARAEPVHPGDQEGLGLTGPSMPPLLSEARQNPYALPPAVDCPGLMQQIADLDAVLGPDLDTAQVKRSGAPDLMAGIREILPYGGVVRLFTGAGRREKALVNSALAGWERRGFLKGTARMMGCAVFGQPENPVLQAQPQPPR